jgi:uncharacterized membrane protein YciS (DUF1049 family)
MRKRRRMRVLTLPLRGSIIMNIQGLPSLPTDNLYKFMALSGVVLLLVAPIFWVNFYISHSDRTRAAIASLDYLPPPDYYSSKAKLLRGESIPDQQIELIDKVDSLRNKDSQLSHDYLVYDRFTYLVTVLAISMALAGITLTWFGFRLWYLRVQKPLDLLLLKKSKHIHENSVTDSTKPTSL